MKTIGVIGGLSWQFTRSSYYRLNEMAAALEQGGVGFVLLCSKRMHKLYGMVAKSVGIPFCHIADALGHALAADGLTHVGLLGIKFVMVEDSSRSA